MQAEMEEVNLSLLADDMILCIRYSKIYIKKF